MRLGRSPKPNAAEASPRGVNFDDFRGCRNGHAAACKASDSSGKPGRKRHIPKAVQRCRIGQSEFRVQHLGTEVKRLEARGIPESEEV